MSCKLRITRAFEDGMRLSAKFLRVGGGVGRLLVLVTLLASFGVEAFGQVGKIEADPTMYSSHRISVQRAHFDEMVEMVIGDEASAEAMLAGGLYDGYAGAWAEAARAARDEMKMIRATGRNKGVEGFAQIQVELNCVRKDTPLLR